MIFLSVCSSEICLFVQWRIIYCKNLRFCSVKPLKHILVDVSEAEDFLDNQYSYPACSLIQAYKKRRGEMQCIHR